MRRPRGPRDFDVSTWKNAHALFSDGEDCGKIRLRSISWGLCRSMNSGGLSGNVRLVVENESWTNLQIQKSLA